MNTSQRLTYSMFTQLDDGNWEYTVLPFMKTRIIDTEQKEDRQRLLFVTYRFGLLMLLGLLITTSAKPLLLWLGLTLAYRLGLGEDALWIIMLAPFPMVVFFFIAVWPLPKAGKALKFKKLLKTAPLGRRVAWTEYWVRVGSSIGPRPIHIVLTLTAICLFGTILVSSLIRDLYLTEIVSMALICLLLGPAIPAGLKSKHSVLLEKSG